MCDIGLILFNFGRLCNEAIWNETIIEISQNSAGHYGFSIVSFMKFRKIMILTEIHIMNGIENETGH